MNKQWRKDQEEILEKIAVHQNANRSYMDEGVKILELAKKASALYKLQETNEKRILLRFVFSNSTWKDGKLTPNFKKPFDIIANFNNAYKSKKAASASESDLLGLKLPAPDSNLQPCGEQGAVEKGRLREI